MLWGYELSEVAAIVGGDLLVLLALHLLIGATAPRWPARWLGPRLLPVRAWESANGYRHVGGAWLARRLPEAGALFGGTSKKALPGSDTASLRAYLVEVRRAELVHVLSLGTAVVMLALPWNPWWLRIAFAIVICAVNAPFLVVLRYNRIRLERLLGALERGKAVP